MDLKTTEIVLSWGGGHHPLFKIVAISDCCKFHYSIVSCYRIKILCAALQRQLLHVCRQELLQSRSIDIHLLPLNMFPLVSTCTDRLRRN